MKFSFKKAVAAAGLVTAVTIGLAGCAGGG